MEQIISYIRDRYAREWRILSVEEARHKSYYGFGGWLLVIYLLIAGTVVFSAAELFKPIPEEILAIRGVSPIQVRAETIYVIAIWAPFLILAPLKHKLFPRLSIWGVWLGCLTTVFWMDVTNPTWVMVYGFAFILSYSTLLTWYLLRSRRVNVTYHHRVLKNELERPYHYKKALQKPRYK